MDVSYGRGDAWSREVAETGQIHRINRQEHAPLVQQAQWPLRSWRKQWFLWGSALGGRGRVIFRRISRISRLYDPFPWWHRIRSARDFFSAGSRNLIDRDDMQEWFDDRNELSSDIFSRPLSPFPPDLDVSPPRLVLRLSFPRFDSDPSFSNFGRGRVLVTSCPPLARIHSVCSVDHAIETSRGGLQSDQNPRGYPKVGGFQYHIPRCLARWDRRLFSGMLYTIHQF